MKLSDISSTRCLMCGKEYEDPSYLFCTDCYPKVLGNKVHIICNSRNLYLEENSTIEEKQDKILKRKKSFECILCRNESDQIICEDCRKEYKDKTLKIEIFEDDLKIEEYINFQIKANDGHIVKSSGEKILDDFLYDNGFSHAYEKDYLTKDDNQDFLTPDFYLPEIDIYIEYEGMERDSKKKEYTLLKNEIYKKEGITVLYFYPIDLHKLNITFWQKLWGREKGTINYFINKI